MASQKQWVEVGGRKLEVSNLDKVLFPDDNYLKAEVLEYYFNIAPTMLYHIKGRPLSLIRFPDGIDEERFYQKNKPRWSPEWIESVLMGSEEQKDYVVATEQATLIWLANLAALEMHQVHSRQPHLDRPDYMVFDLDPPESGGFSKVINIALHLKDHIEKYGYHVFVKTTGGKGLHLVTPIKPEAEMSEVFEAAKKIAQSFVHEFRSQTTLHIKKKARQGRILIDIYRNRTHQTIVCPYSLRGKPGAPVSMPIRWEEVTELESSQDFHIANSVEKVRAEGDVWEGIGGYATSLHTRRQFSPSAAPVKDSAHTKTPEQLKEYQQKRDFSKTREPGAAMITGEEGGRFVIHRHHATRLHYDLRLEREGVLQSWAVPKGLPNRPGVKRLAIQTEDHPLEYLTFEGQIPKGEYGGGTMWIFAQGKYDITKEKKKGLYFRLESPAISGEYRMHQTSDNEWLLERTDHSQVDWLKDPIEPMQSKKTSTLPEDDYVYEVEWDGIRVMVALENGEVQLYTGNHSNITDKFPELQTTDAFRATAGLFDGVIVYLDEHGSPSYEEINQRLKTTKSDEIQELGHSLSVNCYIFDCLYLDGRPVIKEPWYRRQEWVEDIIKKGTPYRISKTVEDGKGFLQAAKEHNLKGIIAKEKNSSYGPGKKSDSWQLITLKNY